MEAISNHAKEAAQRERERQFSEADLEDWLGVTAGNAYLVSQDDADDFVMVVTGVSHYDDDIGNGGVWRRPKGLSVAEFEDGLIATAEFYRIQSIQNGAYVTDDTPFESPTLYKKALHHFPREPLTEAVTDNTFVPDEMF
jgi:hypothetical protein